MLRQLSALPVGKVRRGEAFERRRRATARRRTRRQAGPGFRPADGDMGPAHARRALPARLRSGRAAALRQVVTRNPAAVRGRAVRHAGRRAGARRTGRPAWMDPGRRHRDAAWAAPRDLPAALFRRLPRRGSAPGSPAPGCGRRPRAHPGGPGQNYRSCWSTAWSAGVWHQRRSGRRTSVLVAL